MYDNAGTPPFHHVTQEPPPAHYHAAAPMKGLETRLEPLVHYCRCLFFCFIDSNLRFLFYLGSIVVLKAEES
jgi:hypothetical protein